jgi:hypothetical protein
MLLAWWAGVAGATEIGSGRPFGLGLQLGGPLGITGRYYLGGRRNSLDFLVGAYTDGNDLDDDLYVHVNYHWNLADLTSGSGVTIPFRMGVGGFLGTFDDYWGNGGDDFNLGVRMPVGVDFDLETAPVQFYVEIALGLQVFDDVDLHSDAGLGVRYYF